MTIFMQPEFLFIAFYIAISTLTCKRFLTKLLRLNLLPNSFGKTYLKRFIKMLQSKVYFILFQLSFVSFVSYTTIFIRTRISLYRASINSTVFVPHDRSSRRRHLITKSQPVNGKLMERVGTRKVCGVREKYDVEGHNHRTRSNEHAEQADGDQGRAKWSLLWHCATIIEDQIKIISHIIAYKVLNRNYPVSKDFYNNSNNSKTSLHTHTSCERSFVLFSETRTHILYTSSTMEDPWHTFPYILCSMWVL